MTGKKRGKKMRAALEWRGRKLMCNGVCLAQIQDLTFLGSPRFNVFPENIVSGERKSEEAMHRAVNRRLGLREIPAARRK